MMFDGSDSGVGVGTLKTLRSLIVCSGFHNEKGQPGWVGLLLLVAAGIEPASEDPPLS